jgi:hypothetical protein
MAMMFGIVDPTGSHSPVLEAAARAADGLVLEHGAGLYSTPLLARVGCRVVCAEPHRGWSEWAAWIYEGRALVVDLWRSVDLSTIALAFIDGPANERAPLLDACLAAGVPSIVAHDTHERCFAEYGWRAEHFAAPGYVVTHDTFKRKYRTTHWQR